MSDPREYLPHPYEGMGEDAIQDDGAPVIPDEEPDA